MSNTKYWPTYFLLAVLVVMGAVFLYLTNEHNKRMETIAIGETNRQLAESNLNIQDGGVTDTKNTKSDDWHTIYPVTKPLRIGNVEVEASVAKTWADRIKGLSDTPYLPDNVVKLFVFDAEAEHGIWMKDMNYAIDIIWVDENNKIVDIKKNATPESYPESFTPSVPALYVIETVSGFVDQHQISIGDEVANVKK
ncbi:MAG: DUF192 domain-containing protein [Candidatus Nomurabacteria bacterium]|nr:MAG: DUF192 domain-containing protein [Candidatus Nomurabacteria bacterium]